QEHAMVEFIDDRLGAVLQSNEVKDVVVLVQVAFDFDGGPVIVAVEPLALVAFVADKVPGTEDEMVLGNTDLESLGHGQKSLVQRYFSGTSMISSRRATNKQAAVRSAVAPGLRRWPSARNHPSNSQNRAQPDADFGNPSSRTAWARSPASSESAHPHLRPIKL